MFVPPDGNVTLHPFSHTYLQRYSKIRDRYGRIREPVLFRQPRTLNELELQARWFAGDFGRKFKSTAGDEIEIVQFGTWNREPGPDFRDAAIRIKGQSDATPGRRASGTRVRVGPRTGCIEIDLIDRNWELHGHATNPAFDETVLHVFVTKSDREFFTRTTNNRNVPQIQIDPAVLPDAFRLEAALAKPGRCCAPLRNLPEEQIRGILDAAARFRLQRKATALRTKIESESDRRAAMDEILFREIAGALGYKENKLPFMLLAQRLPLKFLRDLGDNCEAVLFGVAAFLGSPDLQKFKRSTRSYLRELWDRWWPHRDEVQRLILPLSVWKISSTRPSNHPQRRLGALATLVREWPRFRRSLGHSRPARAPLHRVPSDLLSHREKARMRAVTDFFRKLDHPFWDLHYTLTAGPMKTEMALIGESRITEILANVIFPFWFAENEADLSETWNEYVKLPARLTNRRLETGAVRLFGDDHRRKDFLKTVAHQQGLLQIFEDFCLQDDSDCAHCPFPEQMAKWV